MTRCHGGADAQGLAPFDFSTNSNACGPCPPVVAAITGADALHYPDPLYTALRSRLAAFHGVSPDRVLVTASGSEAIARLTATCVRGGARTVAVPPRAYGDYGAAAQAWGLRVVQWGDHTAEAVDLGWVCDPDSPVGAACEPPPAGAAQVLALDRAYAPLRLAGPDPWPVAALARVWQVWSPNKALGLTGLRGAYVIAPLGADGLVSRFNALAPSWPLGGHAEAMLGAWVTPAVQDWVVQSHQTLRAWKERQWAGLTALGWRCTPSDTPFFTGTPPQPLDAAAMRAQGLKLRDTTSMGLPGAWRLGVRPPAEQDVLFGFLKGLA